MTIRRPTEKVQDIRDSVFDIIETINTYPKFEIKTVDIISVASSTITVSLTSSTLTKLHGAMQINSTADEVAYVTYKNTQSVKVSWDFGASTSGRQTVTFLLIGS